MIGQFRTENDCDRSMPAATVKRSENGIDPSSRARVMTGHHALRRRVKRETPRAVWRGCWRGRLPGSRCAA